MVTIELFDHINLEPKYGKIVGITQWRDYIICVTEYGDIYRLWINEQR